MHAILSLIVMALCCLLSISCNSLEVNRHLEDMIGSAARTRIAAIGEGSKKCFLVRLNITNGYAIVIPDRIIRLGENYSEAGVKLQFAQNGADYAVLELKRKNGVISNYLLQLFRAHKLFLFDLATYSDMPFSAYKKNGLLYLVQATDKTNEIRLWQIESGNLYGPRMEAKSFIDGKSGKKSSSSARVKKPDSSQKQPVVKDMPRIKQDTEFKLEPDTPPATLKEETTKPMPAPVKETIVPAADPYTIVID